MNTTQVCELIQDQQNEIDRLRKNLDLASQELFALRRIQRRPSPLVDWRGDCCSPNVQKVIRDGDLKEYVLYGFKADEEIHGDLDGLLFGKFMARIQNLVDVTTWYDNKARGTCKELRLVVGTYGPEKG